MRLRALALGLVLAAAWTGLARVSYESGLQPVRPLYDGSAPPRPYSWVNPPKEFAEGNVPPGPTTRTFKIFGERSPAEAAVSDDGQASIAFAQGGFVMMPGQTAVELTIAPLDAALVGPPPEGIAFDGNAYVFSAVYLPSREPLRFSDPCPEAISCATIVLRYAVTGPDLYRRGPTAWERVDGSQHVSNSLQVYGNTEELGTFVAGGVPQPKAGGGILNLVALGLGVVAVLAAVAVARFGPARKRRRPAPKKRPAKGRGTTKKRR